MKAITMKSIKTYPKHVKTNLDKAEYKKDVLEHNLNTLKGLGASEKVLKKAHAEFFQAYLKFADIATRACEQGLLS